MSQSPTIQKIQEDEDFAMALALQADEEQGGCDEDISWQDHGSGIGDYLRSSMSNNRSDAYQPTIVSNHGSDTLTSTSNNPIPSSYFSIEGSRKSHEPSQAQQIDDHSFAWILQQMEFEIPYETEEERQERELNGEFEGKEYRASKCKNQLRTLSTFLVVVQVGLFWAMCESEGLDDANPMTGPSSLALVEWGAKDTALIVYRDEWWRIFTPIMMHAGVLHLLSNTLIQLRVGGYLNIVFGTTTFAIIYLLSGIFGNLCSCIFLPEGVSVGASGALLGILTAWSIWIVFRWNKIPEPLHGQRNCQLTMVVVCITITLAMSFTNFVDWAAHFGGAIQGMLLGLVFLSHELDNESTRLMVRVVGGVTSLTLFTVSIWYLAEKVRPNKDVLLYYDYYNV